LDYNYKILDYNFETSEIKVSFWTYNVWIYYFKTIISN